jgi:hypothetical protein
MQPPIFSPSPEVSTVLNALLDIYERRFPQPTGHRPVRLQVGEQELPGYHSQIDPEPRLTANEQLAALAQQGYVQLSWLPGQEDHLLQAVTLAVERVSGLFPWLERQPVAQQRSALRDLLLGDRFRFPERDWRSMAIERTVAQLRAGKSPAPFVLTDPDFNQDLLTALIALDRIHEETPYRVFSVQVFSDSKAFDRLKGALATLARRHEPDWRGLTQAEVLRELGLVANPSHLLLAGPWSLVDDQGEVITLAPFRPAVGIPALLAARVCRVIVDTRQVQRVVCVENVTAFYELMRHEGDDLAALCLWGNPAPATCHLLARLVETLPAAIPLQVWTDLDNGGLGIVAGLRRRVSPRFVPYRMDSETLEAHVRWAKPLTASERRRLARLQKRTDLADLQPLIATMLQMGLKLEQEAVQL